MLPPTEAAIDAMIAGSDLKKDELLGVIPPLNGIATVERVAANVVMAGCLPDYFPLVRPPFGAYCSRVSILTVCKQPPATWHLW